MNDQDEMFEAATETPAFLGCPQHMPKTLPGGFDGTEPASAGRRDADGTVSNEAKAKLEAAVARQRDVLTQIADLALAAEAKSGNANVKLGSKFLDNSKAICAIRQLCGPDLVEKAQIESGAFYTPGWLCEPAKKLQGAGTVPSASSPTGANKAAQDKFHRKHWTFCDGLFPISFVVTQEGFMERCTINGRKFKASVTQEDQLDAKTWNGYIYDNGKCVCMIGGMGKGKCCVLDMTHAAFKAYVKQLSGSGKKYHNRKGFLRKAVAAAKAAGENGGQA